MIRKIWSRIIIVMYNFFRVSGSLVIWYWLAIIISGRSQVVSSNRGVDSESEKNSIDIFKLLSQG